MKQHKYRQTIKRLSVWLLFVFLIGTNSLLAQEITFTAIIVDEANNPVSHAMVTIEGKSTVSDIQGNFSVETEMDKLITINAPGYLTQTTLINSDAIKAPTIVMSRDYAYISPNEIINIPFGETSKKENISAISTLDGDDLLSYPDLSLLNALAGRVSGLYALQKSSTPGWNSPTLTIRGLSGSGNNSPLIMVDGIERSANELLPEEIENVQVIKDISAKIIYGSRAANGVIFITTKRGLKQRRDIHVSGEYGMMMPTSDPQWLDASEYATLYNEARTNDGLSPYYSANDIAAYRNGSSPVLHPNNNYHKSLLNSHMPMGRAALQFQGGGSKSTYYVNLGYTGTGGYENIAEPTTYNKVNIRSNLDIGVTSITTLKLDIAGRMEFRRSANMTTMDFFDALSTHRPNEYPISFRDASNPNELYYGGSYEQPNNIYAMGNLTKYKKQLDRNIQFNIGFDFDLNSYLEGLDASAYLSYDNETMYRHGVVENAATYKVLGSIENEDGSIDYDKANLRIENLKYGKTEKLGNDYRQRLGFIGQVNFLRNFNDKHRVAANFITQANTQGILNVVQDNQQLNYALRVNYAFNKKYIIEADLSYVGSSYFTKSNRFALFPAIGLGWVLSEEEWLKNNSTIDYLKLKAAGGEMGSDQNIAYYLYQDRWKQGGTILFGPDNKTKVTSTNIVRLGNPDLSWEKAREMNIGIEGLLLNRQLSFEFNYFNELRYDIIEPIGTQNPSYIGATLPLVNNGEIKNAGVDGDIVFHKYKGQFTFDIGFNFVYSKSKVVKANELNYPEKLHHLNLIGQANDAIVGYVGNGLLSEGDLSNYHSSLGQYAAGDIKYQDLYNDGIIDNRDRTVIGNSFPRMSMGTHVNLKYKGVELYALGVFNTGFDVMKNNKYFWAKEDGKYSTEVNQRWTATNTGASYPRLTSTAGTNNYVASSYWLEDASFFKLKNIELSYTLPNRMLANSFMRKVKVYARGTNLFSISKFSDLDPENIDAGIKDYPLMSAITGGISVTF